MTRKINFLILCLLASLSVCGQENKREWYLNASINAYVPGGNSDKSIFPVLGYNRNTSPKLLLGGVGTGASLWSPVSRDLSLKVYTNISKHTYWDEPLMIKDAGGASNGIYNGWSSDYVLGVGATIHYNLAGRLSVGAGAGTHVLIASLSGLPEIYGYGVEIEKSIVLNHYYKRILPVVPLEVSYKLRNALINLRYDLSPLNRLKGQLGKSKSERYGILALEVGFRLR
ncbi:hypothetical protein [Dyadobacter psychrotolerans]|uniref:Outer membrane protein beta-barrel domain-containing protein n=1 Tax=Dyadobacter psychrotolerans TaxID=2541721 RepID=A0A4R5DJE6_9BACT|nr:hypothetical protein [Dyadobacter psychrotolerans]TDE12110.1 hypothetical protein E0F88_23995 [Dyadobacter psychrotolerans]